MFVTFQSSACPDVLMLRDQAQYFLGLVGKRLGPRGVITHQEMANAIGRLEAAIAEDEIKRSRDIHVALHASGAQDTGLAQRAHPFLEMMRASRNAGADILWGL
jgi:Domain of unknown function (DUF1840)